MQEIVIKIDENLYTRLFDNGVDNYDDAIDMAKAIRKGTVLPEGHGDLKDADNLKHAFIIWSMAVQGNFTDADIASIIYNSPTIIEADRSEE